MRGVSVRIRMVWLACTACFLVACAGESDAPRRDERGTTLEVRPAAAAQVLDEVRRPGATAVVLNVWATWCLPCKEEFPDLMRLYRAFAPKGVRLVLVAADFEDDRTERVREFLAARGVDFPTFLKEQGDQEFIDAIEPRWSGALPVTFVYDGAGNLKSFREGKTDYETLEKLVLDALGPNKDKKEDG